MRFYGKTQDIANGLLEQFRSGALPKPLALVFLRHSDDLPCRKWSWGNQLLTAIAGHSDARGFRQWQDSGRAVRKGEHAFHILVPLVGKKTETDDDGNERERVQLYGFKSAAVFGRDQTDVFDSDKWQTATGGEREHAEFLSALPLIDVTRRWGVSVDVFDAHGKGYAGFYAERDTTKLIGLGVKNLSVWAHELCHAADRRCHGELKRGQHVDQETVATLGSAVLLEALGIEHESDAGRCWAHIQAYAERAKRPPIAVCLELLNRTCDAVAHILQTANELASETQPATVTEAA